MKRKSFLVAIAALGLVATTHAADSLETSTIKGTIAVQTALPVSTRLAQARIGIDQAIQAASKILQGKVIKAELEEEDGFLVWEVEVITDESHRTELLLDAGDGTLLKRKAKAD